jgi:hypothetical protein
VTLDQFNALCDREWARAARGDVKALHLTDGGYKELLTDAITIPGPIFGPIHKTTFDLWNPVTRSVVTITGGAASDTAEVYAIPESRTVTL